MTSLYVIENWELYFEGNEFWDCNLATLYLATQFIFTLVSLIDGPPRLLISEEFSFSPLLIDTPFY